MATAFLVSLACLLLPTIIHAEYNRIFWHIGTAVLGFTTYVIGRVLVRNRAATNTLTFFMLVLLISYMITAIVPPVRSVIALGPLYRSGGSALFNNPNLFGAAIAILASAIMCIRPRYTGWIFALGGLAILFTGSRTAAFAYLGAGLLTYGLVYLRQGKRGMIFVGSTIVLLLGVIQLMISAFSPQPHGTNLLEFSGQLDYPTWNFAYQDATQVKLSTSAPPIGEGQVFTISSRATEIDDLRSRLVITQTGNASAEGVSYVASVYLKARVPQTITLGSNLAWIDCIVDTEWSRCQTPPGIGNGKTRLQFQLLANDTHLLELDVWGAQLEAGVSASRAVDTTPPIGRHILNQQILSRWSLDFWLSDDNIQARREGYLLAWNAFGSSPMVGVGNVELTKVFNRHDDTVGLTHAHNLLLQILAESGLLGAIGLLLPIYCALHIATQALNAHRILPILVCALLLNTTDMSYFHMGSYYIFWLSLGLASVDSKHHSEIV